MVQKAAGLLLAEKERRMEDRIRLKIRRWRLGEARPEAWAAGRVVRRMEWIFKATPPRIGTAYLSFL